MTKLIKLIRLLLFVALMMVSCRSYAAVAISDLIETEGSVISGDKMFDQFTFSSTGDMPPADEVMVDPFTDLSGNYGIRLFGAFLDYPGGGASDLNVSYRVTALDPDMRISGSTLQGNPTAILSGSAVITSKIGGQGELKIFDETPGSTQLVDSTTFASLLPELDVEVQLTGEATGEPSAITVSFIDQTFSQSVVPEPASAAVWLGMAFLVCVVPIFLRRTQCVRVRK